MTRLIKAELFRLKKEKSFFVVLAALAGFSLFGLLMTLAMLFMMESAGEDSAEMFAMLAVDTTVGGMMTSNAALSNIGIFTAIAIGLFNGRDFSGHTVRNKITAGYSRDAIFTSMYIVNMIMFAALFLAAELVTFGAASLMALGGAFEFVFSEMFLLDLFLLLLVNAAFVSIVAFFSLVFKKTSSVIITGVLLCVLLTSLFSFMVNFYIQAYITEIAMKQFTDYGAFEWISRINLFSMDTLILSIPFIDGYLKPLYNEGLYDGYLVYRGWLYGNAAITSIVWGAGFFAASIPLFRRANIA